MAKQIIYADEARKALKRGIDKVADAVKITIGPKGRNVILDKGYGTPLITNDGVTIAKEISLKNKFEDMGAEIIKEVASKTNDLAGDGTTTAMVLAQAIIADGLKKTTLGVNPMGIRLGIEAAATAVSDVLKSMSKPLKTKQEIEQIATISSESSDYGRIIAEAVNKVGEDGVVTVEESQAFTVESELVEGMQFDRGYISPYMVTDSERMEADYRDSLILIFEKKISAVKEILPLLDKLLQAGKKELVIIAEDVDGEALATLVVNKIRGTFNTLVVKSPGFGDRRKEMLEDIAVLTGGEVVAEEKGLKLENVELRMLGRARRVVASKDETTIVGGAGRKADIEARVNQIKRQIELTDSQYDKDKLKERLGKLSGGVAVVRVGAATEAEMKYAKLKIEDAVEATKAAIKEGIVTGGGTAFVRAGAKVAVSPPKSPNAAIADEFDTGVKILLKALSAPLRQIALNAGREDVDVIVDQVRQGKGNEGYDAQADRITKDMFEAGIIDPLKVVRTGLERSASAAAILLTSEAAVAEEPEKKETAGGGMPGGMGGGMGGMDGMDY